MSVLHSSSGMQTHVCAGCRHFGRRGYTIQVGCRPMRAPTAATSAAVPHAAPAGLTIALWLWLPSALPQAALLRRMIDSNIDAILVKIAAAGLTPRKHLGARLASLPAQVGNVMVGVMCRACPALHLHVGLILKAAPQPMCECQRCALISWRNPRAAARAAPAVWQQRVRRGRRV